MKRLGNIIMVDDNQNDVSLVSFAIQEAGLTNPVKWISTGEMLIRCLTQWRALQQMPLLVVMDWRMPGNDPLDILRWIRKQPEYLGLLVVVLTGSEDPNEKKRAYEAGANWHLVKSAGFADLAELVSRIQQFWSHTIEKEPSALPEPC